MFMGFCHPEPQAKGLLSTKKGEILRRLCRLRLTKKRPFRAWSIAVDAV
jgi:hypothetical protein